MMVKGVPVLVLVGLLLLTLGGFVVATRALTILALLLGIVCILVTGLWFVLKIENHQLILMITSLGTGFLCGLFSLIAIIVYAAEVKSKENALNKVSMGIRYSYTLGWSFALCTVASVLAVIAVLLIAVGIRMRKQ